MVTYFPFLVPLFTGEDIDAYNLWLSQFERYLGVTESNAANQLDLFLLCAGSKATNFHNEVTWPPLTQERKDAGQTEYKRAVDFVTRKFAVLKTFCRSE